MRVASERPPNSAAWAAASAAVRNVLEGSLTLRSGTMVQFEELSFSPQASAVLAAPPLPPPLWPLLLTLLLSAADMARGDRRWAADKCCVSVEPSSVGQPAAASIKLESRRSKSLQLAHCMQHDTVLGDLVATAAMSSRCMRLGSGVMLSAVLSCAGLADARATASPDIGDVKGAHT
jgi:hypothetical protein